MTAFAGLLRRDGGPADPSQLNRLTAALETEGAKRVQVARHEAFAAAACPDGPWPEEKPERQPHRDGSLILCLDCCLDDPADLSHRLNGGPDVRLPAVRLVAQAIRRWGRDAPLHLYGDFAYACWDADERRLTLACDALGGRTLYYYQGRGLVAFATTLRTLLALPGVPREIDESRLADFLVDRLSEPDRTFYRGIVRVPPGTLVTVGAAGVQRHRCWQPPPGGSVRFGRDADYVEMARELLDRAVMSRLPQGRPVASTISGGLDSSAVSATAARLLDPGRLDTLTVVPAADVPPDMPGFYPSERPLVEKIAALHPNIAPHFIASAAVQPVESDPGRYFLVTGEPFRGMMNIAWYTPMYAQARELGARVLLIGSFGNQSLSWDGISSLRSLFLRGSWGLLAAELRALARSGRTSGWSLLRRQVLSPLLPPGLRQMLRRGAGGQPWIGHSAIHPQFAAETRVADRVRADGGLFPGHGTSRNARLRWVGKAAQRAHVRRSIGRIWGLDIRDPLADRRLVEFLLAIPEDLFLRDGIPRSFARRVLADRLPEAVLSNHGIGAQCPEWFARLQARRDQLASELDRIERSPLALRCLDTGRMRGLLARWPADAVQAERQAGEYRSLLARGIHAGQFLRWFEGGNS